jgi:hypothetical protein
VTQLFSKKITREKKVFRETKSHGLHGKMHVTDEREESNKYNK